MLPIFTDKPNPTTLFQASTLYKGKVEIKFFPKSHIYKINGKSVTGVTTILGMYDKSAALVSWATELFRDHLLDLFEKNVPITMDHVYEGCNLHNQKKTQAADIGTEVHDWIEAYINNENPAMPKSKEAQIGVTSFLEWVESNKVKFISSERVVYSKKHNFVGKMDIEAKVNGKLCLIDIKTSNGIYNTYYMQTAAYARADEEESGREYQGRYIIRLSKETEKEYNLRMKKKNINRVRNGKEEFNYPPYEVFESKFLDDKPGNMERDFKSFLACKVLKDYDKETGFWAKD